MPSITLPTAAEMFQIEQDLLPNLTENYVGIKLMPTENSDTDVVMWEQEDNYGGLQQLRGLGGDPKRVKRDNAKRFVFMPGVYGEYIPIDEVEMTRRRRIGSLTGKIQVADLIAQAQKKLLFRRMQRLEMIFWTLALGGVYTVPTTGEGDVPGGAKYVGAYTPQSFVAGTSWSDHLNSTPLADLRAMKLLSRGHSVDFGPNSNFYLNTVWVNHLMSNVNPNDLGGRRGQYGATFNSLNGYNEVLKMEGLPTVVEYDEFWLDDAKSINLFIANAQGLLVGRRSDNSPIMKYLMTRNANNPDAEPGPYTIPIDRGQPGPGQRIPREIEVHDGHNGGAAVYYPSALVSATL